ncbi:SNF2-related protein [Ligilactobacillus sp. LYQ135]
MNLNVNQINAIQKLGNLRVGALFMEPGTGKTRTAIELIKSSQTDLVLFLVPFQTKDNLRKEFNKWNFNYNYRIEGIESLSNSDRLYLDLLKIVSHYEKPFIVVDESLKIKNRKAKRTQRILEIGKHCYYRLILNGTPLSKNILDLWSQMQFLSPKILKMGFNQFKETFVEYVVFRTPKGKQEQIKTYANMDYLYSLIKPYVFDSKLDLGITEQDIKVEYIIANKDQYIEAKECFLNALASFDNDVEFLAHTTRMQMTYSMDINKINVGKQLISNLNQPSIIFCKYVETQKELTKRFPQCLVITYGKGSLGLNLQKYKNIIFWDKTWDYAQLEQAKRRIYRIGQSKDVRYYHLTGDVGLEKMMDKCIDNKISLLNMFKNVSMKEVDKLV